MANAANASEEDSATRWRLETVLVTAVSVTRVDTCVCAPLSAPRVYVRVHESFSTSRREARCDLDRHIA